MTNKNQLEYVCSAIRRIRMQKHISQMELSLRANLSQSFLANVERCKKEPSVLTLIRIANALDVSPRDFFPDVTAKSEIDIRNQIKNEIILLLKAL